MLLVQLTNTSQRKAGKKQLEIIFQLEIIGVCKKSFLEKNFYPIIKILIFFKNTLILTKCLVNCMFELTDVYYFNIKVQS